MCSGAMQRLDLPCLAESSGPGSSAAVLSALGFPLAPFTLDTICGANKAGSRATIPVQMGAAASRSKACTHSSFLLVASLSLSTMPTCRKR